MIPIKPGTKKPMVDWKEYTERHATTEEIQSWTNCGVGLVMGRISGFIGVDADTRESAKRLWDSLPATSMVTQTPNGGHLIYRCDEEIRPAVKTHIKGIQCDIRGESSYLVAAPTIHPTGKPYSRWGKWKDAPEFDKSWIEKSIDSEPKNGVRDIRKYLQKIVAVSGEGGHNTTYRAACVLRDAGLSESEALAELVTWNETNCIPRWEVKDLLHKVKGVFSNGNQNNLDSG